MAPHLESSFAIRNLLASAEVNNPSLTPPPSDGFMSSNDTISSNEENSGSRLQYTYSVLVTMAIRNSPEAKLTLRCIQNWVSGDFPYYHKNEQGWQNQIRETLSTNSCFHRVTRPMEEPGRGNYRSLSPDLGTIGTQLATGVGNALGPMTTGVPHHQLQNAVNVPTSKEMGETQRAMLMQALQEQQAWFSYLQQQAYILQQQLVRLQHQ